MEAMDVKYKPLVFPNGAIKKAAKPAAVAPAVGGGGGGETVYRECLKNHAASLGGHALDGCGEFMPSPAANPADPTSLRCAACGCHRNFHRRLPEGSPPPPPPPALLPAPPMPPHREKETPEVRLPGVECDKSDSDSDGSEYDDDRSVSPPPPPLTSPFCQPGVLPFGAAHAAVAGVERGRAQRLPPQKQRMQELSERLGWRLQKRDEAIVDEWCRDIGVGKGVFKVWMHNNKHNYLGGHSARRSASSSSAAAGEAPPFNPPTSPPPPPPPPPHATDFNINGTATAATAAAAATIAAGNHQENGASSPQSA
ncbi:hypothetical protein OsJ_29355 [Oryza sativa Japonica Group]|uniref:ZF-HD dimerization-type domain-containing protein n=1 Tax=Oryza sativa subsp. japonica TaxID=39947 RepID=B9G3K2_ORYSJ|nr:hypothetical protein OsJ_29355 [Oryza sativa Japonica Group]